MNPSTSANSFTDVSKVSIEYETTDLKQTGDSKESQFRHTDEGNQAEHIGAKGNINFDEIREANATELESETNIDEATSEDNEIDQIISCNSRLLETVGEDGYNSINSKLNDIINSNPKLVEHCEKNGVVIEDIPLLEKSLLVGLTGLANDPDVDNIKVTMPILSFLFASATIVGGGANTYNLTAGVKVGINEALGAQYTTTLTVISAVGVLNDVKGTVHQLLHEHEKQHGLEPSDNKIINTRRLITHIKETKHINDSHVTAIMLKGAVSITLGILYSWVDTPNAAKGLGNLGTQLGLDQQACEITGLITNGLATAGLGAVFFYNLISEMIDSTKAIFCENTCNENNANSTNPKQTLYATYSEGMLKTVTNVIIEHHNSGEGTDLTLSLTIALKEFTDEHCIADEKKLAKQGETEILGVKTALFKINTIFYSAKTMFSIALGATVGAFTMSAVFASNQINQSLLDMLNLTPNNDNGYMFRMIDGTLVNYTDTAEFYKSGKVSDLFISENINSEIMTKNAMAVTSNALQGVAIGATFLKLVVDNLSKYIKQASTPEGRRELLADGKKHAKLSSLCKLSITFATVSLVTKPYMEAVASTVTPAEAFLEFTDSSFKGHADILVYTSAAILGLFGLESLSVITRVQSTVITAVKGKVLPRLRGAMQQGCQYVGNICTRITGRRVTEAPLELGNLQG